MNKIQPPPLPAAPGTPVIAGNPPAAECGLYNEGTVPAGTYADGGDCIDIKDVAGQVTLEHGHWRFVNQSGISVNGNNSGEVVLEGGTYQFERSGIQTGGNTDHFEMRSGTYAFLGGAQLRLNNVPDAIIGGGALYFAGNNSGIEASGNNGITLGPGEYVFDGGRGFEISGNSDVHFGPGDYVFFFDDGADLRLSGNSEITYSPGAYVKMYFYGGFNNMSEFISNGNSDYKLPPGEYHFDNGRLLNSGNQLIEAEDVFLYFSNGGYLESTGNASFAFQAPETEIYPGYHPGVFMYSDRSNCGTRFTWNGNTSALSGGAIYLPCSTLHISGNSNGKVLAGQVIANDFDFTGNNALTVEYQEVVAAQIPMIALVE